MVPSSSTTLDAERMIDTVGRLVTAESPTADVTACDRACLVAAEASSDWLAGRTHVLRHRGRSVWRWGAARPRVLLLGHLDTVWPIGTISRIPFARSGDRLTGPGVFDMKAGVVQGWAALAASGIGPDDGVGMLLTTDEEEGSSDSRDLILETCAAADAVLVLEPSADGALKTARKGTSWYVAELTGRAAHAGLDPERGTNAAVAAAELVIACGAWADRDAGTSVTPTLVRAGTTANTVPAGAEVTIDVRAWTAAEQARVDDHMRRWSPSVCSVHLTGGINRPALDRAMSADLWAIACHEARALGQPVLAECAVGGASDGNFTAAAGIPTLDGLGAVGDGAHAEHEWVSVAGMTARAALLARIVAALLED
jgi:glutamate carboxypeptidase